MRNTGRTRGRTRHRLTGVVAASLLLISCSSAPPQKPSAGTAYAGPTSVNLRQDLGPRANTVGTVQHGERLDVIEMRRRFVKVRTSKGVEGWTDANYLLSQQQVSDLDRLAEFASRLPSQGAGTTYDSLNVHVAPSRQAPSFMQIPEGASVEVLLHRVTPRVTARPVAPPKAKPKQVPAKPKTAAKIKKGDVPPPPTPPPPAPPANWVELSRPRVSDPDDASGAAPEPVTPPARSPSDDWYLVRAKDGKAGWVLARQISMSIPDEVAQYAEGHVITGYLSLGKDEKSGKDNWLWTTSPSGPQPFDFDSFRVFVWSTKHNRYETGYIERNVRGRDPIQVENTSDGDAAFSVILEDKDGQVYKRTYAFSGFRVKMIAKTPYQEPPAPPEVRTTQSFEEAPPPQEASWGEKLRDMRQRWFKR